MIDLHKQTREAGNLPTVAADQISFIMIYIPYVL